MCEKHQSHFSEKYVRISRSTIWTKRGFKFIEPFVRSTSLGINSFRYKATKIWNNLPQQINKTNLRDLIAATCLVIFLKLDSNYRIIGPCDLEIWWMTSKNNKAPLIYYTKLCAPFQINWWSQTGVKVWKRPMHVKIGNFLSRMTLKFDWSPWKTIGHLFYITSSFVQYFKAIGILKLELQSRNAQFGSKLAFFVPRDLGNSRMTFKNNMAHLLCFFKLCASFQIHRWNETRVAVRKHSIRVKIGNFLSLVTLKFDG